MFVYLRRLTVDEALEYFILEWYYCHYFFYCGSKRMTRRFSQSTLRVTHISHGVFLLPLFYRLSSCAQQFSPFRTPSYFDFDRLRTMRNSPLRSSCCPPLLVTFLISFLRYVSKSLSITCSVYHFSVFLYPWIQWLMVWHDWNWFCQSALIIYILINLCCLFTCMIYFFLFETRFDKNKHVLKVNETIINL